MIKYHAKDSCIKLSQLCKDALDYIEYRRCIEVIYPPLVREVDEHKSLWSRSNSVCLSAAWNWDKLTYKEKFNQIDKSINDDDSYISYMSYRRWFLCHYGHTYKRNIEQLIILIGAYMPDNTDDYIEVDGDLLENIVLMSNSWQEMVKASSPDTQGSVQFD